MGAREHPRYSPSALLITTAAAAAAAAAAARAIPLDSEYGLAPPHRRPSLSRVTVRQCPHHPPPEWPGTASASVHCQSHVSLAGDSDASLQASDATEKCGFAPRRRGPRPGPCLGFNEVPTASSESAAGRAGGSEYGRYVVFQISLERRTSGFGFSASWSSGSQQPRRRSSYGVLVQEALLSFARASLMWTA